MGEVIFFQPRRNAERSERAAQPSQEATILFFTGVRYQRHVEPVVAPIEYEAPPKGGIDGAGGRRRRKRG
jgi:hypothetical protein